ncbi:MAG: MBL fold metallo-hydrolase [Candidatus Heimdallarchaeota archaeon]|nr:MBL fold metallo-hydrolase [Candidatus Heimdallarchaeota archaeon]
MKKVLEWIGTGSGLNPTLGNTSFMVTGNSNKGLLVDCGSTVPLELIKSGKIGDITDIIITHLHADHIGGLEGFGFMNYFALNRRGNDRPNLYVATETFAHELWENALKAGMQHSVEGNGKYVMASLDTYFNVHVGKNINVRDITSAKLFETPHVQNLENYGVEIGDDVFYSGDTIRLPETNARLIFQDCQFFEGGVHVSYDKLNNNLSPDIKKKMYLVHLGGGHDKKNPIADGFAGFVKPGEIFEI